MNNKRWNAIWINSSIAPMTKSNIPYGMIDSGAIAVNNGKIAWIGHINELSDKPENLAEIVYDASNHCITPGLIDCHTHLVYAGNRYQEFVMRLEGASYADIAKAGGGIRSTVAATRAATEEELLQQSLARAELLLKEGVTTIEIKSGYGLDLATERKILRVAKQIGETLPLTVKKTFLGAHALPSEYQGNPDAYIDLVCEQMMPILAKENLIDAVDVFCETIGFSLAQTERVFLAAKKLGLPIKCHAEQLSDSNSAALAAEYHALSVDHLEFVSKAGITAITQSGTVAVLLPGAFYFLRETQLPPVELLREQHVPMAIATDCNPGTSPVTSLLLMLNMACTLFKLTPEEAWLGVTHHAAKALGIEQTHGSLAVGKTADFVLWKMSHPAELAYRIGWNPCVKIIKTGAFV